MNHSSKPTLIDGSRHTVARDVTKPDTTPEIVLVGPFRTRSQAAHDLGCSGECLLDRDDVLRIGARLSQEVYPAFQFEHHQVRADVAAVVHTMLQNNVTGAVIADWFVHPHPHLGGATPLEWLNHGRPGEDVDEAARLSMSTLQDETAELRSHNLPYPGHYGPDS